ncbi:unnamed protein product [Mytilus coruscus]|uniref:Uncharacterized protein n=1 Tax=Mytilus coruscus TaxID=42192 RepID=A0A6J8B3K9_MYTCO|nr:unnamed protein product [Mytilus coruscus]
MKIDSVTQSDFDLTFHYVDLMCTPDNRLKDQLYSLFSEKPLQPSSKDLDCYLKTLQDVASTCQPPMSINTETQYSSTESYNFIKLSATEPDYPQLDINRLDEFLLQELEFISTELSVINATKRGQKVKKRLFVSSNDGEPNTKRRRTESFTDTETGDDIEFIWTSCDSARRSRE